MKNIYALLLVLLMHTAKAQGPQQLIQIPYDFWNGATVPAWIYLPADYATSTKKYPVVFFYHGVGEAGSNPYTVLNQGIPNLIANGMRPDNITNPVDGQQYSFIVVSAQHWSWSPLPQWLPYEIQYLKQNYRIDTNRIYVTGLSAGGQTSYNVAVGNVDVSKLIAAAAPMSPAQVWPYDPSPIGQNKIKTWFFAGSSDGGYTNNAINYSNDCNNLYPASSRLNLYPGGHCCWVTYYNKNWHDPATGYSIWEWMLTNTRQAASAPLPVRSINVEARRQGAGVRINWTVQGEENLLRYEVERSRDGRSFSRAGEVAANGGTNYAFADAVSEAFYRVKVLDIDGKFKYSSVVRVQGNGSGIVLSVYPQPAREKALVQHPDSDEGTMIRILTPEGRLLQSVRPERGSQQTELNVASLKAGMYFIRFEKGGIQETLKLIRQ